MLYRGRNSIYLKKKTYKINFFSPQNLNKKNFKKSKTIHKKKNQKKSKKKINKKKSTKKNQLKKINNFFSN